MHGFNTYGLDLSQKYKPPLYVYVNGGTIRKKLNKYDFHGREDRKSPISPKQYCRMSKDCKIASEQTLHMFWHNILWPDDTKVEMFSHFAQQPVWRKPNTTHPHKDFSGPKKCSGIETMVNSTLYTEYTWEMWGHLLNNLSWVNMGSFNRTMILRTSWL